MSSISFLGLVLSFPVHCLDIPLTYYIHILICFTLRISTVVFLSLRLLNFVSIYYIQLVDFLLTSPTYLSHSLSFAHTLSLYRFSWSVTFFRPLLYHTTHQGHPTSWTTMPPPLPVPKHNPPLLPFKLSSSSACSSLLRSSVILGIFFFPVRLSDGLLMPYDEFCQQ